MAGNREERQIQQVAEAVTGLLAEAVKDTIDKSSPEPARECIAELIAVDRANVPDDSGGPAELMATLSLVRWGALARTELAERADWVEQVLDWIERTLGRRYRARAGYTVGALRSEEGAGEIMIYSDALREDFLPSLVWLIAGTVAVHGGGDVAWLRDLERAALTGR